MLSLIDESVDINVNRTHMVYVKGRQERIGSFTLLILKCLASWRGKQ